MYKWWHKDYRVEQIWDHIKKAGDKQGISVIENTIEDVMNGRLLLGIEDSWNLPHRARQIRCMCYEVRNRVPSFAEQFR